MQLGKKVRKILAVAVLLGFGTGAQAALPTSGKCGFVMNIPHPEINFNANWLTNGPQNVTLDVLGEIDFAAATVTFTPTNISWNNTSGGWSFDTPISRSGTWTAVATSTIAPGAPANESTITMSFNGGGTFVFNTLPTNSNNTLLIQGTNKKITGVCQME